MTMQARAPLTTDEREKFESNIAEIFSRLGMDLTSEGCKATPQR
jgi:hypothetical protein